jgi:hypothetical protein
MDKAHHFREVLLPNKQTEWSGSEQTAETVPHRGQCRARKDEVIFIPNVSSDNVL